MVFVVAAINFPVSWQQEIIWTPDQEGLFIKREDSIGN